LTECKNCFAIFPIAVKAIAVTQPLAIVLHERLMPGSQLVNRLQDLNYRVLAADNAETLANSVKLETPLLLFVDLKAPGDILGIIGQIKADAATAHVPIIAFAPDTELPLAEAAKNSGANLAVADSAVANHLPQLIDQALLVE
jgi:CheY-like chemotaxis protein